MRDFRTIRDRRSQLSLAAVAFILGLLVVVQLRTQTGSPLEALSTQDLTTLVASLICTLIALFSLGVFKGRLARMAILSSGLQVAIIGSLSAGLGFAIGRIVNAIAG